MRTTADGTQIVSTGSSISDSTVDRSGSVTAGGTAQQLAAANPNRKYLEGQNISDITLWINENGGTATTGAGSYSVPAGAWFAVRTKAAVSILGATTGKAWTATEG